MFQNGDFSKITFTKIWTEIVLLFMRSYCYSWVRTKDFLLRLCEHNFCKVTNFSFCTLILKPAAKNTEQSKRVIYSRSLTFIPSCHHKWSWELLTDMIMTFNKKAEILSKRPKTSQKGRKMHEFWPKKQEFLLFPENSHACTYLHIFIFISRLHKPMHCLFHMNLYHAHISIY